MPRRARLTAVAAAIVLTLGFVVGCGGCNKGGGGGGSGGSPIQLDGQGATFVEPVMKVWAEEYGEKTKGDVRVNYQGTGSGAGVAQMTKKLADFGCSDAPMNKKQTDEAAGSGGPVVHVPLVIGAVVPVYNVPGVDRPLAFTGPLLADIFMGKVAKWDDPKIKELNPGVALPDLGVQPVYRADPSGTSFIFSDYLCKVSPDFKKAVGASTTPKWPDAAGTRQNKTDGVAGHVGRTPGAVGYVELTYALDTKATYGKVRNKTGADVLADLTSITAAAATALGTKPTAEPYSLHDLTYNLTDADGAAAYPIAGMSFAVLYQNQTAAGPKGKAVVAFLKWCVSAEGQGVATHLNYAPLPDALQARAAAALDRVEVGN